MDQMTLFELPYKYIMDTSSILSQKPGEPHNRLVYKSKWNKIESFIRACLKSFDKNGGVEDNREKTSGSWGKCINIQVISAGKNIS